MRRYLAGSAKVLIPAAVVAVIALVAVGMLGVASAEAPTTSPPPPTVSVQGVAIEPIEQSASSTTATTVYRQAMAAAITDGQAKAQFLASSAGATLERSRASSKTAATSAALAKKSNIQENSQISARPASRPRQTRSAGRASRERWLPPRARRR